MSSTTRDGTNDNVIKLGKYPQFHPYRADEIEWIVLKNDPETLLLISKYALITSGYCDSEKVYHDIGHLEWEHSLAREVCTCFYETAFSSDEKDYLVCKQDSNGVSGVGDYVFLLTEEEVNALLPDIRLRKAKPTPFALKDGARLGWTDDTREYTSWWIMPEIIKDEYGHVFSPEGLEYRKEIYPKAVLQSGDIQYHGRNVYHSDFTIRPCILLNRTKYISAHSNTTYSVEYMKSHKNWLFERRPGEISSCYDTGLKQWRIRYLLDEDRIWFLSEFIKEDGTFKMYSLDKELADDSHYEFTNEKSIRKRLYSSGDEERSFDQVLIRFVAQHSGEQLLSVIRPYITAEYHYD